MLGSLIVATEPLLRLISWSAKGDVTAMLTEELTQLRGGAFCRRPLQLQRLRLELLSLPVTY
jgi:hypothetical protein